MSTKQVKSRGGGERRSKRSKANLIQQHTNNRAYSFFFDIKQDESETRCLMDEIMTKALTLGGEIVDEIEDADFVISNRFDEELVGSGSGMVLSEKFIEESYSKGVWIADVSAFVLSPSENLRKKQKKSKYSDEEISNMMNFIYQHNNKSFDLVEEELFESMASTTQFEGRSAQGLSRKFSQLSKNTLKTFLKAKDDEIQKNLHPLSSETETDSNNASPSILDSLIGSIEVDNQNHEPEVTPEATPSLQVVPPSNTTLIIDERPEDPILKELKTELTKDQIFSFMCEIIGFPLIIENKGI